MAKPKVLICAEAQGVVWSKSEQDSKLGAVAEVIELSSPDRKSFIKDCGSGGKYDGVVAIYRHNGSAKAVGLFDKELVEALPKSVKYVCHNGAGYDQIDVDACTARGIEVSHTPGAVDDATATVGVYLTLSAMRGFHKGEVSIRDGKWMGGAKPSRDPEGKTVGIIGMGGIGSTMAKRFIAFDMKVLYHNRKPINPAPSFPCTYCANMDDLLAQSDIVSINMPLNENTRGSFGKAQFDKMKDGSVLVNTARGAVVDEEAMIAALESGKLSSVGLDVFPEEPKVNPKLLAMENITLLPHMGTYTSDSQRKMELQVFDNIISAIHGKGLLNQVPEQRK